MDHPANLPEQSDSGQRYERAERKTPFIPPKLEMIGSLPAVTGGPQPGTFDAIIFAPGGFTS